MASVSFGLSDPKAGSRTMSICSVRVVQWNHSSHPRLIKVDKATCRAAQTRKHSSVKKLLFVCGGTGGHVFPAIAIAEHVREISLDKKVKIQFMGVDERDSQPVLSRGFSWIRGDAVKMERPYLSARNILNIFRLLAAIASSMLFMLKNQPDVVLGKLLHLNYYSSA